MFEEGRWEWAALRAGGVWRVEGRYHLRTTRALCEENSAAFPSSVFVRWRCRDRGERSDRAILAQEALGEPGWVCVRLESLFSGGLSWAFCAARPVRLARCGQRRDAPESWPFLRGVRPRGHLGRPPWAFAKNHKARASSDGVLLGGT